MSHIVVVDDDREMARLLQTLLELEGYQVTVVRTYDKILPTLREVEPDIVFMDVQVQDKQTIALVQALRQEECFFRLPVIMASGLDRRHECLGAGANCFMLKPFLPDDLIREVNNLR